MNKKLDTKLNFSWFIFALLALSISGFYSIFVSMMRIPFVYKIFHYPDFFKISLIIHVTLSINIFFILFIFFNWIDELKKNLNEKINLDYLIKIIIFLTFLSIILIAISGFFHDSKALTINYIPIINNLYFLFGIAIFFFNLLFFSILYFYLILLKKINLILKDLKTHLNFFIFFSILISFICLFCYLIQIKILNSTFELEEFFWGFGHILQFVFIELSVLCLFLNLTENSNLLKIQNTNLSKFLIPLSFLKFILLAISPLFYFSENNLILFTNQMKYGIPIFLIPINLYFLIILFKKKIIFQKFFSYIILSFIFASLLGLFGGKIAFFIKEVNVTIPAHYHGSLISLIIVIMSFFYSVIENKLDGYSYKIKNLINVNFFLYFFGHLGHISGLLLMGGYGALRKNPGNIANEINQTLSIKIAKYIFFAGSLISILGGMIFIFLGIYLIVKVFKKD